MKKEYLQPQGEKSKSYKWKPTRIVSDFSIETLKARGAWCDAFQKLSIIKANLNKYTQQNCPS